MLTALAAPVPDEAGGVLGVVHTVGPPSASAADHVSSDGRLPLFQLVLAAEVALAGLLFALARSARFVAFRIPSMAAVGRAAPALLMGGFYVLAAVLVSGLALLAVG